MKPAGLLGAFAVMAVAWTEAIAVNPADYGHSPTGANAQIIPWVANFFAREWTKRLAEAPVGSGSRLENLGVTLGGGFQFGIMHLTEVCQSSSSSFSSSSSSSFCRVFEDEDDDENEKEQSLLSTA